VVVGCGTQNRAVFWPFGKRVTELLGHPQLSHRTEAWLERQRKRRNTVEGPEFESGQGTARAFSLLIVETKVRRAERKVGMVLQCPKRTGAKPWLQHSVRRVDSCREGHAGAVTWRGASGVSQQANV